MTSDLSDLPRPLSELVIASHPALLQLHEQWKTKERGLFKLQKHYADSTVPQSALFKCKLVIPNIAMGPAGDRDAAEELRKEYNAAVRTFQDTFLSLMIRTAEITVRASQTLYENALKDIKLLIFKFHIACLRREGQACAAQELLGLSEQLGYTLKDDDRTLLSATILDIPLRSQRQPAVLSEDSIRMDSSEALLHTTMGPPLEDINQTSLINPQLRPDDEETGTWVDEGDHERLRELSEEDRTDQLRVGMSTEARDTILQVTTQYNSFLRFHKTQLKAAIYMAVAKELSRTQRSNIEKAAMERIDTGDHNQLVGELIDKRLAPVRSQLQQHQKSLNSLATGKTAPKEASESPPVIANKGRAPHLTAKKGRSRSPAPHQGTPHFGSAETQPAAKAKKVPNRPTTPNSTRSITPKKKKNQGKHVSFDTNGGDAKGRNDRLRSTQQEGGAGKPSSIRRGGGQKDTTTSTTKKPSHHGPTTRNKAREMGSDHSETN
jgi:hypothetical protein